MCALVTHISRVRGGEGHGGERTVFTGGRGASALTVARGSPGEEATEAQACVQRLPVTVAEVGVAMLADQACAAHHMEQYV